MTGFWAAHWLWQKPGGIPSCLLPLQAYLAFSISSLHAFWAYWQLNREATMGQGACEPERWGQDQAHISTVIPLWMNRLFQKCGREILVLQGSSEGKSSCWSPILEHLRQCQQQKEHPSFSNPAAAEGIRCSKEKEASSLPFLRCHSRRDPSTFNHSVSYMGVLLLCFSILGI